MCHNSGAESAVDPRRGLSSTMLAGTDSQNDPKIMTDNPQLLKHCSQNQKLSCPPQFWMSSEVVYKGLTSAQSCDWTWLNVREICKTSVLFNALINSLSVVPRTSAWLLFHVKSEVCSRLGFLTPDAHRINGTKMRNIQTKARHADYGTNLQQRGRKTN